MKQFHPLSATRITDATLLRAAQPGVLPALGPDEIDVLIVDITARDVDDVKDTKTLAPEERARASRFKSDVDQACFVRRRAALRAILAGYLGIEAADIAFTANEFGKPSVVMPQASAELSFSASHSGALALVAVGRFVRVGIDVERLRTDLKCEDIAARFFAAGETAALAALPRGDRVKGFFNAWTRKEAVVKALGGGLSIPLDSFEVSLRPGEPPAILRCDIPGAAPQRWRIHHIEPAAGYVGALAVDRVVSVRLCGSWLG